MLWELVPLGDLAAGHDGAIAIGPFGSAMKADTYTDSGVSVIRGTNISDTRAWKGDWVYIPDALADSLKRCMVFRDDLVLPHRGSIGEVAIIPADETRRYFISSSLMKITLDRGKIDPLFCYYFLRSPEGRAEILRFSSSVGTPGIGQPLTSLRQVRVPVPPLTEQRAIAAALGALDDKIELNRKMNATLEAIARALFRDWFVDFGPTRAKMEGRAPYLSPDLWPHFPDRLDAEGKPEGWEESGLLDLATLVSGGTPKTDRAEYWNGCIPWASAKDVSQCKDTFLIETERSISESGLKNSATKIIPKYATVVVARGATTGRSCMFGSDIAMNQTCYALTSRCGHPFWLNCAFRELVGGLVNAAHGSVFDTITTRTIETVTVIHGPRELRDLFEHLVNPLFQRLLANVIENRSLAQTRDLLLPRLMLGELRVADLEETAQ